MESTGGEVGRIHFTLDLDDSKFKSGLNRAKDDAGGFGNALSGAKDASVGLLAGVTAATVGAIAFGASSVASFADSENQIAQTEAVLKSTGHAAGMTADDVDRLSKSLESQTTYSDEAVRSVTNLLLTFTSIHADVMPQATSTVLDMATALGEDTQSAAIQLGKALQDPINGITALRRVGVNFSDSQKQVIQNLMDTGRQADAQKLILKELNTEFGGSAVNQAQTYSGALKMLGNQFDDMKEIIGQTIVQALDPFIGSISVWIYQSGGAEGVVKKLTNAFKEILPYLPVVAGAILGGLVPAFWAMAGSIAANMIALAPFILAGAALAAAWTFARPLFFGIAAGATALAGVWLANVIPALVSSIPVWWSVAAGVIAATWPILLLVAAAVAVGVAAYEIVTHWTQVSNFFTTTVPEAFRSAWADITGAFNAASIWIGNILIGVGNSIANFVIGVGNWFMHLPENLGFALGFMIAQLISFVTVTMPNFINGVISWFAQLPGNIWNFLAAAAGLAAAGGAAIVNGVISFVSSLPGRIYSFFAWVVGVIASFGPALYGTAVGAGNGIVSGMRNVIANLPGLVAGIFNNVVGTIQSFGGRLWAMAENVAGSFWQGFKRGLGIRSPSYVEKAFMAIGAQSSATLAQLQGDVDRFNNFAAGINNQQLMATGPTLNSQPITTNFNGPVNIAKTADASEAMNILTRNQELAQGGLTTVRPTNG